MDSLIVKQIPTDALQDMLEGEVAVLNLIQSEITRINAYVVDSAYARELVAVRNPYADAIEIVKKELIERGIEVEKMFKITGRPEIPETAKPIETQVEITTIEDIKEEPKTEEVKPEEPKTTEEGKSTKE